ncbi:MAG TPA: lasso peptide biosynthesis B2 protein [Armatimonadota bacterium]|jgi:hypothetical protein
MARQSANSPIQALLDRGRLLEALAGLLLARTALRYLSFARIERHLLQPLRRTPCPEPQRSQRLQEVRHAVARTSRGLPGGVTCFERALAGWLLLRRRGIAVQLYYGATARDGDLKGHVWLQDGERGVLGLRAAEGFQAVTCYDGTSGSEAEE